MELAYLGMRGSSGIIFFSSDIAYTTYCDFGLQYMAISCAENNKKQIKEGNYFAFGY